MTTYAIGDIQGCFKELQTLLKKIKFDPQQDKLWLVGDLVNRGPQSLETLRFVKQLGERAVTVLGNHDLHLIAVAYGVQQLGKSDTFHAILTAPDCDELIEWLCQQPLIHHDEQLNYTLVHAGILPQWSLSEALMMAKEVERVLQRTSRKEFLTEMYGNKPACWQDDLPNSARLRFIINVFTRMRYVDLQGCLNLTAKMPLNEAPADLMPWYDVPQRKMAQQKIIFGHWAALNGVTHNSNAINLDTGCVWGNALTAMDLESQLCYLVQQK